MVESAPRSQAWALLSSLVWLKTGNCQLGTHDGPELAGRNPCTFWKTGHPWVPWHDLTHYPVAQSMFMRSFLDRSSLPVLGSAGVVLCVAEIHQW